MNSRHYYRIPGLIDHAITTEGSVKYEPDGTILDWNMQYDGNCHCEVPFVRIGAKWRPIYYLLAETFIGHLDWPIISRGLWYIASNLTYAFTPPIGDIDDGRPFFINDVEFREIPYFPGYYISKSGVIIKRKTFKIMHRLATRNHYPSIQIGNKSQVIHKCVYEAFNGPVPEGMVIDHKDNDTLNPNLDNLQLITQEENIHKSYIEGGNKHRLRWRYDEIMAACEMIEQGIDYDEIASRLNITTDVKGFCNLLFRIHSGLSYKELASRYNFPKYQFRADTTDMTDELKKQILQKLSSGQPARSISTELSIPISIISRLGKESGLRTTREHLTIENVQAIYNDILDGQSTEYICAKHNVGRGTYTAIRNGTYRNGIFNNQIIGFNSKDIPNRQSQSERKESYAKLKYDIDIVKDALQLMAEGKSMREIGHELKIEMDKNFVYLLNRIRIGRAYPELGSQYDFSNYDPGVNTRLLSSRQAAEIIEKVKRGARLDDLAAEYGVDRQVVARIYSAEGLAIERHKFVQETVDRIKADIDNGMTVKQIREKYGIGNSTYTSIRNGTYRK